MELGLTTFVELTPDPRTGRTITPEQRLRDILEEAELAEQVGLDVFGVGEHHRPDFVASAPAVVLAAIAARTRRIRLSTAVTVLSSADPVRVFQEFATIDLLSGGRAEIMAGRGSFIESFALFGYDLRDYDALFAEKLDLLLRLRESERVTWRGRFRPPLEHAGVYPRPVQHPLPVSVAVGGTPESVIRAGKLGLPLSLAIIGGLPERFTPLVDLYRATAAAAGHDPARLPVSIHSHGFIDETAAGASDVFYPPYAQVIARIGRERGWPAFTRAQYDAGVGLRGALFVGSPEEVVEKILHQWEMFRHDRMLLQFSVGTLPHDAMLRAIELFGTRVAPAVRKAVALRRGAPVVAAVA